MIIFLKTFLLYFFIFEWPLLLIIIIDLVRNKKTKKMLLKHLFFDQLLLAFSFTIFCIIFDDFIRGPDSIIPEYVSILLITIVLFPKLCIDYYTIEGDVDPNEI